jgi:hypothetical protein
MAHPLVDQLRFTRSEWLRALKDMPAIDAERRFMPMNSVSWIVGHLAWQEHLYWFVRGQGKIIAPQLDGLVGYGAPASIPSFAEMMDVWRTITSKADPYLDTLTTELLTTHPIVNGEPHYQTIGTLMRRMTYHYWYHIGEIMAIRQMLDHPNRSDFVGDIQVEAPYRPE